MKRRRIPITKAEESRYGAMHRTRIAAARAHVERCEQGCGRLLGSEPMVPCGQIDPLTSQRQYCFPCNPNLYYARELLKELAGSTR